MFKVCSRSSWHPVVQSELDCDELQSSLHWLKADKIFCWHCWWDILQKEKYRAFWQSPAKLPRQLKKSSLQAVSPLSKEIEQSNKQSSVPSVFAWLRRLVCSWIGIVSNKGFKFCCSVCGTVSIPDDSKYSWETVCWNNNSNSMPSANKKWSMLRKKTIFVLDEKLCYNEAMNVSRRRNCRDWNHQLGKNKCWKRDQTTKTQFFSSLEQMPQKLHKFSSKSLYLLIYNMIQALIWFL